MSKDPTPTRRITQAMAEEFIDAVVRTTFKKRAKKLADQQHALGLAIIKHTLGEDYARFKRCPSKWFDSSNSILVNASGQSRYVHANADQDCHNAIYPGVLHRFSEGKTLRDKFAHPYRSERPNFATGTELGDRLQEHFGLCDAFKKERDELVAQVRGILAACKTVRQLEATWPDGKKFIPEAWYVYEAAPGLPAVLIEAVNTKIAELAAA